VLDVTPFYGDIKVGRRFMRLVSEQKLFSDEFLFTFAAPHQIFLLLLLFLLVVLFDSLSGIKLSNASSCALTFLRFDLKLLG